MDNGLVVQAALTCYGSWPCTLYKQPSPVMDHGLLVQAVLKCYETWPCPKQPSPVMKHGLVVQAALAFLAQIVDLVMIFVLLLEEGDDL